MEIHPTTDRHVSDMSTTSATDDPMRAWWESISKARSMIQTLPPRPALSSLLLSPSSVSRSDPLYHWHYDTFLLLPSDPPLRPLPPPPPPPPQSSPPPPSPPASNPPVDTMPPPTQVPISPQGHIWDTPSVYASCHTRGYVSGVKTRGASHTGRHELEIVDEYGEEDEGKEINDVEMELKKGGWIPLPWELLRPTLRILGHCLLAPLNPQEVKDAASVAVRSLYARASHDLVPQVILATRSLIQLDNRAREAAKAGRAAAEAATALSNVNTPSKSKKPKILLVSK